MSEEERLRKALEEARPYVYNRTQGEDWRAETARDVLSRVDGALHPAESLYACPTCDENVTRYGRRCPTCERSMEHDRLERESGR